MNFNYHPNRLTSQKTYSLKVEMTDMDDVYAEAYYETVEVGPGPEYRLVLGPYVAGDGVADAGDSLSPYGKNNPFHSGDNGIISGCNSYPGQVGWCVNYC